MIDKLFSPRISAQLVALALVCNGLAAQVNSPNSAAGPDDDLGTLPSTNSGKPPTINEDDLGTLPASKGEDSKPTLTFSGPVTIVPGLLAGVRGEGEIGYGPGAEPGSVIAYLTGDLTIPLHADDPRLAFVKIELRTGDLPSIGELSAGGLSTGTFHLAPGTHMGLPVRALFERSQPWDLSRVSFELLTAAGEHYRLGMRAQGAFLILQQSTL